jgi:hypothetical protein
MSGTSRETAMTIRPAVKMFLIDVGLFAFAICACVAIMQVHLWQAHKQANAASGNMASTIKEIQTRPQLSLYVQRLDDGSMY